MPAGIIHECTRLMRRFLWGGSDVERKIAWVKWSDVCKLKAFGGLGIKDLATFNKALIGKWRWRFVTEPNSFWCRVIKSQLADGRCASPWWRDVLSLCSDDNWFDLGIKKSLGEGDATRFWLEDWLGSGHLEGRFHRLYNLSQNKYATVKEVGEWRQGIWEWKFTWRRGLRGRELGWLDILLNTINIGCLREGRPDRWLWEPGEEGVYSVNSAYSFLQVSDSVDSDIDFQSIWNGFAPSKVKAFVWRMLLNRIPTKVDLRRRSAIPAAANLLCSLCNIEEESCDHLFCTCARSLDVWLAVHRWFGFVTAVPSSSKSLFSQFSFLARNKKQRLAEMTVWMASCWSLWLMRNSIIFSDGVWDDDFVLDLIQVRSWYWIKEKVRGFYYSLFEWKTSPLICLSSV